MSTIRADKIATKTGSDEIRVSQIKQSGTFADGLTITKALNEVFDGDRVYKWVGTLPKVVAPGESPAGNAGFVIVSAPLSSPAFTGVPTAPTAAADTNNTQLANTAFVQQEIQQVVDEFANGTADIGGQTAQSIADLRNNLADGTADVGGAKASDLAKATINVPNLKALASIPVGERRTDITYHVMEFDSGTGIGGHDVKWLPLQAWTSDQIGLYWPDAALNGYEDEDKATLYTDYGGGPGCWGRSHLAGSAHLEITPESLGARPDGVYDSTLPIRRAIRIAVLSSPFQQQGDPTGMIRWGVGVYRITESGVFSDYGAVKRNGIKHVGAGPENTIVWLDPSALSGDAWFYDNGATSRAWNSTHKDMSFHGGITWRQLGLGYSNFDSKVKGFNFTGLGWESAHVFENCTFAWLDTLLKASGTNNADTHRFSLCTAIKCRVINFIDNPQSMNITWDQCYLTNIFGDFAVWGSGVFGGGNLAFTNGTMIFTPDDFGGGVSYIVNASVGGTAVANATVSFDHTRFEIKGQRSLIANITQGVTMVGFDDCTFWSTTSTSRDIATVGGYCDLSFNGCSFSQAAAGGLNWIFKSTTRRAKQATIRFKESFLSKFRSLYTFTFDSNRGSVRVTECWEELVEYPTSTTNATVVTINGVYKGSNRAQDTGNRQSNLFIVDPLSSGVLPATGGVNTALVSLPPNCVLCGVFISFPAGTPAATGSQYRILVGNVAQTVVYATSATVVQNAGLTFNEKIAVKLGSTVADATVAIWADNGAGGTSGASLISPVICYLEYY